MPEDLRKVIEAENDELAQQGYDARFRVQPLPQPGQGCRERVLLWHSYGNGVPISKTEVAKALDSQIRALHPRFKWDVGEGEQRRSVRQLLETILYEDQRYASRRR